MSHQMITKRGYDFFEVSSSIQKAVRRNDPKLAGYFALEMFDSGYSSYVWKRLYTISAEDVALWVTQEIKALHEGFKFVNKSRGKHGKWKGRIFISKAIMILCEAAKSRDSDHLQCFIYDKKKGISDSEIEACLDEIRNSHEKIPDYAFDCHTMRGKAMGKTKEQFFKEENEALQPKQPSLFDDLI